MKRKTEPLQHRQYQATQNLEGQRLLVQAVITQYTAAPKVWSSEPVTKSSF